jgi:hypothetical protein
VDGGGYLPNGIATMVRRVIEKTSIIEADGAPKGQLLAHTAGNGSIPSFANSWLTLAIENVCAITNPSAESDTKPAAILRAVSPNNFPRNKVATVTPDFSISCGEATMKYAMFASLPELVFRLLIVGQRWKYSHV